MGKQKLKIALKKILKKSKTLEKISNPIFLLIYEKILKQK